MGYETYFSFTTSGPDDQEQAFWQRLRHISDESAHWCGDDYWGAWCEYAAELRRVWLSLPVGSCDDLTITVEGRSEEGDYWRHKFSAKGDWRVEGEVVYPEFPA